MFSVNSIPLERGFLLQETGKTIRTYTLCFLTEIFLNHAKCDKSSSSGGGTSCPTNIGRELPVGVWMIKAKSNKLEQWHCGNKFFCIATLTTAVPCCACCWLFGGFTITIFGFCWTFWTWIFCGRLIVLIVVGFGYLMAPVRPDGRAVVGVVGCGVAGRCVTITNFCCCAGWAAAGRCAFVFMVVVVLL